MRIQIFLETSAMPRYLMRPGHAVHQLVDLVEAKLVKIHASTVTAKEWRSQMIEHARKGIESMHKGLQTALRQEHLRKLSGFKELSKLAEARESMLLEVDKLTGKECDRLFKRLGLNEIPFSPEDSKAVFDDYFAGAPPFAGVKRREDIPDAFIHCAAKNLSLKSFPRDVLAVCKDARLADALGKIDRMKVVKDLNELIQTEEIQEAMTRLTLFNAWSPEKRDEILGFLRTGPSFATNAIQKYALAELPGIEFSDISIPVDNNVATIDNIDESENLEIDWEKLEEFGPGWLVVPFTLECEAGLSLQVYRADTFAMPDWVDVEIGDFEQDYYFDASANRTLRVSGSLSMQYSKEDLDRNKPGPSRGVEVEDVEIELVPLVDEYEW